MAVRHRRDDLPRVGDPRIATDDPFAAGRLGGGRDLGVGAQGGSDGAAARAQQASRTRAPGDQAGDGLGMSFGAHPGVVGVAGVLELMRGFVGGHREGGGRRREVGHRTVGERRNSLPAAGFRIVDGRAGNRRTGGRLDRRGVREGDRHVRSGVARGIRALPRAGGPQEARHAARDAEARALGRAFRTRPAGTVPGQGGVHPLVPPWIGYGRLGRKTTA